MTQIKQPFEAVVAEHGATVLRVCRAVLGPHPDAEDAWSETFLAALRAYPGLPVDANIQAWLVTIAHRKAIDITRARQRQAVPVGEVPEVPEAAGPSGAAAMAGSLAGAGDPAAGDGDMWAAVKALPDKQRQAVAYHYLAALPYKDIAALVGGSTDAARRAAADGIRNLRTAFAGAAARGADR
jgi:RNA polymerase sigma factor (sigma-70 family)